MKLDRTLPAVWQLTGADIPALAPVASRAHTVVLEDVETLCASIVVDFSHGDYPYVVTETADLYESLGYLLGRTHEVLDRYDPTKGRRLHDPWTAGFRAWLHVELTNDLHDYWRSRLSRDGRKRSLQIDVERDQVETFDSDDPEIAMVLSRLPKQHRVVATLLLEEGLSVSEIAERQGVSRPAASKYVRDLQAQLRLIGLAPAASAPAQVRQTKEEIAA